MDLGVFQALDTMQLDPASEAAGKHGAGICYYSTDPCNPPDWWEEGLRAVGKGLETGFAGTPVINPLVLSAF